MKVIVYPTETGVAIVTPAPGFDIEAIAAKDVPEGVECVFVDSDDLPDRATRARWALDGESVVVKPPVAE